jgi:hypothetical protein
MKVKSLILGLTLLLSISNSYAYNGECLQTERNCKRDIRQTNMSKDVKKLLYPVCGFIRVACKEAKAINNYLEDLFEDLNDRLNG